MERKIKILLGVLLVFALIGWYFAPTSFLKSQKVGSVETIHVFNATNGRRFIIDDERDISHIVKQIQKESFRKREVSLFRKGSLYTLSFRDSEGKKLEMLTVNSDRWIRKDPFSYATDGDMEILNLLREIEESCT